MKSALVFALGLIVTAGGVGGVEQSLNNLDLLKGVAVAFAGLCLMLTAVPYLQENNND